MNVFDDMKILVLGAGVVGTTSAWFLAKAGHEVTVVEGIESAVTAFLGLFSGDNLGKMVVKLGPEPR